MTPPYLRAHDGWDDKLGLTLRLTKDSLFHTLKVVPVSNPEALENLTVPRKARLMP